MHINEHRSYTDAESLVCIYHKYIRKAPHDSTQYIDIVGLQQADGSILPTEKARSPNYESGSHWLSAFTRRCCWPSGLRPDQAQMRHTVSQKTSTFLFVKFLSKINRFQDLTHRKALKH